ncbi:hypothetical protein HAZT_HAZT000484, partial [Hyalella azteca]
MPSERSDCPICMEEVMQEDTDSAVWAPCCRRNDVFHKMCMQRLALSAGYFFKCPLCNDKNRFILTMQNFGIYVPEQDASWELEPNAFNDLLQRPVDCMAPICMCPNGRSHKEENTSWELQYCRLCGSQAIHSRTSTPKRKMQLGSNDIDCDKAPKRWTPRIKISSKISKKIKNETNLDVSSIDTVDIEDEEPVHLTPTSLSSSSFASEDESKFSGFSPTDMEQKENKRSP